MHHIHTHTHTHTHTNSFVFPCVYTLPLHQRKKRTYVTSGCCFRCHTDKENCCVTHRLPVSRLHSGDRSLGLVGLDLVALTPRFFFALDHRNIGRTSDFSARYVWATAGLGTNGLDYIMKQQPHHLTTTTLSCFWRSRKSMVAIFRALAPRPHPLPRQL